MPGLKWDLRFLELAKFVAAWSKDPSTKCGAVIAKGKRIVSVGFNGLPPGVRDSDERLNNRDIKYKMMVHCERNAMLFAREPLKGTTLYTWPFMSCSVCAAMVIAAGISRHVAPMCPNDKLARWAADMKLASDMFKEAGVRLIISDAQ